MEMDGNYKIRLNDKKIEEPVTLETAADLRPRCIEYAEHYEHENGNDKEDVILEKNSDESEAWDCETIITTYSNLDNHPGKIEAPGGKRKKKLTETVNKAFTALTHVIALKGRDKLPVDFFPFSQTSAIEAVKDKSKLSAAAKEDGWSRTKQEKKERKAAIKEEKRESRRNKKDLKGFEGVIQE